MTSSTRDARVRTLWSEISTLPGLSERLGVTEAELLSPDPSICLVNGDVCYEILLDNHLYVLVRRERGNRSRIFVTNDARAFAVQLVLRLFSSSQAFSPNRSPYEEAPMAFEMEERIVPDEYEIDRVVIRWHWGAGQWAEVVGHESLLSGLEWAWLFSASDETLSNVVADREGFPLFRPHPGPQFAVPDGDLRDLTLKQWQDWCSTRTKDVTNG